MAEIGEDEFDGVSFSVPHVSCEFVILKAKLRLSSW